MVRLSKASDKAIKSGDLYSLLNKYQGKKVQIAAFETFYIGKIHKINRRLGQVQIKDGDDVVTLEVERITGLQLI